LSRETQNLALVTIVQDMTQEMGSEYIVPYVMLSREPRKRNHALYKSILERSKKM